MIASPSLSSSGSQSSRSFVKHPERELLKKLPQKRHQRNLDSTQSLLALGKKLTQTRHKINHKRLLLENVDSTPALRGLQTDDVCPVEAEAAVNCFINNGMTTEEEAVACYDCFKANYPTEDSEDLCTDLWEADCKSVQDCDSICVGCASLVMEWDECLIEDAGLVCDPWEPCVDCVPTPFKPCNNTDPSPPPECEGVMEALATCFVDYGGITTEAEETACFDCVSANIPDDGGCTDVEEALCLSEVECRSVCGGCGKYVTNFVWCFSLGVCDRFFCYDVGISSP